MANYLYRITHLPTNTHYIGCRKCKGSALDDLGTTYFTSSKRFRPIFKTRPRNEFKIKFVSVHDTYDEALAKEQRYLIRVGAITDSRFYNEAYWDAKLVLSPETESKRQLARLRLAQDPAWIEQNRQSHLGQIVTERERQERRMRKLGTHQSDETKRKQSVAHKGQPKSPEHRQALREAALCFHELKRTLSSGALTLTM